MFSVPVFDKYLHGVVRSVMFQSNPGSEEHKCRNMPVHKARKMEFKVGQCEQVQ